MTVFSGFIRKVLFCCKRRKQIGEHFFIIQLVMDFVAQAVIQPAVDVLIPYLSHKRKRFGKVFRAAKHCVVTARNKIDGKRGILHQILIGVVGVLHHTEQVFKAVTREAVPALGVRVERLNIFAVFTKPRALRFSRKIFITLACGKVRQHFTAMAFTAEKRDQLSQPDGNPRQGIFRRRTANDGFLKILIVFCK